MADDWFEEAARAASRSVRKSELENLHRQREEAVAKRKKERDAAASSAAARRAAAAFEAVTMGAIPAVDPSPSGVYSPGGGPPRAARRVTGGIVTNPNAIPATAEQGLQAILREIKKEQDPDKRFTLAGEWLMKITNGISELTAEEE